MTLMLIINLDIVKMYPYVLKMASAFQKLQPEDMDTKVQANLTEIITSTHACRWQKVF